MLVQRLPYAGVEQRREGMAIHIGMFETSVQETQGWLVELAERLGFTDIHYALHGLTTVLHALRDELSVEQNAALAAQMPTLLRGIYFQDWQPHLFEPKHSSRQRFLERIDAAFERYADAPDPVSLSEETFDMLEERISGECEKIRRSLSSDLRALWPGS
jgi:uncharacterized protein (DUF2267 family)